MRSLQKDKLMNINDERRGSEDSEKPNKEEIKLPKKRILKMNRKNLDYLDETNNRKRDERKEKRNKAFTADKKQHKKLFKIQKTNKIKAKSHSNEILEKQENSSSHNTFDPIQLLQSRSTGSQSQENKQGD
mmetsp:Transcript_23513/g.26080  ORF Transcript_23513/g.26080 Transcript_23513/m.26080 type:complete len:131 (+) Transcript_23513:491-883(+)